MMAFFPLLAQSIGTDGVEKPPAAQSNCAQRHDCDTVNRGESLLTLEESTQMEEVELQGQSTGPETAPAGSATPHSGHDKAQPGNGTEPAKPLLHKKAQSTGPESAPQALPSPGAGPQEGVYAPLTRLNFFHYGIGFLFGFDPMQYGFSGMVGYRHLNTFKGFPGTEGGSVPALDLLCDLGVTLASADGESLVSGFAALTLGADIFWFTSLDRGNTDRTGNGLFIGAKIAASYSKEGFLAEYGPALGWSMIYYNAEKKKYRTTSVTLYYYPPTMKLGIIATTNF
jgi:hypothetical protein